MGYSGNFKLIKSNFKFSIMNEHNKDTPTTYKKSYTIIKIISVLEELFKLVCSDILVSSKKNLKVTINKSELIKGLFKTIPDIIDSKKTCNKLIIFCDIYQWLQLKTYYSNFCATQKLL